MKGFAFITLFFILFSFSAHGQNLLGADANQNDSRATARKNWNVSIQELQKVFIENKGQFDCRKNDKLSSTAILYGINNSGVEIYFTSKGIIYRHDEVIKKSEDEKLNEDEEEAENSKLNTVFMNMQWIGANPSTQIIGEEKVSNYFTYSDLKDKSGKSGIRANAFKKITYKNIYPNIDIEYTFPENKSGIKYSIILHPGADSKAIKIKYDGVEKLQTNERGNFEIESSFGEFIDHAPITYNRDGAKIQSLFILENNIASFQLEEYDINKTVIIDPWITVPVFGGYNSAYDIDWDYFGNIYVYGSGTFSDQLSKLNSSGVIQWTCVNGMPSSYGDFAIDRNTGTAYICEGYHTPGARLIKVNTLGSQVALSPDNPDSTNEYWRIAFNSCTGKGVIGAGGTTALRQACTFDTNLNVLSYNVLSANKSYYDISLLAMDDTNCYMATAHSTVSPPNFNNVLVKCPLPTLLPLAYMVPDNYSFAEAGYVYYHYANGFNGMVKSARYLYTYDGAKIEKWNPSNGVIINSVSASTNQHECGGIAVDACDNIFVGTLNSGVKEYDSTLTLIATDNSIDSVYDLTIGLSGQVFACGSNFVSALTLYSCSSTFNLSASSTTALCPNNDGTATAIVTGGVPPYSYYWSPVGKTTSAVTGLAPGTYQVSVFQNNGLSCVINIPKTATVIVKDSSGFIFNTIITNECTGNANGNALVNVIGGAPAYTYNWSNGQSTQTSTGLPSGTYSVVITDANGCTDMTYATITTLPNPIANISSNITIFQGQSTTLSATGGTNYLWSNGGTTTTILVMPTITTVYCVTVTDINNCKDNTCATVTIESPCDTAGTFFFPNAFSPNGDGENDFLRIYYGNMDCIKSLQLLIYDRWGELVYETIDPNFSWDGTYQNKTLITQVLAYHLSVGFTDSQAIDRKGNISLVR